MNKAKQIGRLRRYALAKRLQPRIQAGVSRVVCEVLRREVNEDLAEYARFSRPGPFCQWLDRMGLHRIANPAELKIDSAAALFASGVDESAPEEAVHRSRAPLPMGVEERLRRNCERLTLENSRLRRELEQANARLDVRLLVAAALELDEDQYL